MNISQIAKLAGVAPATVSRYLNNGYVSEEKKERIRRIIEETGYRPMTSAQIMRTGKSHLVAVIMSGLRAEPAAAMSEGITKALSGTGYRCVMANTGGSMKKELEYLQIYRDNDVDGVILMARLITREHHELMLSYKKPIVILGQFDTKYPCVYYDDHAAANDVVEHMIKNGCKHIGALYSPDFEGGAQRERFDGYYDAVKNGGLEYDERLTAETESTVAGGYESMKRLIESGAELDGVFCSDDAAAFGAINYLQSKGYRIPEDIKVGSVGDSYMSAVVRPSLTTAHLHYETGGKEASKILIEKIEGNVPITKQYKLGHKLCERDTTKAIAK